jgi:transcriptional regulator with XRE-family HTH domain
MTRRLQAEGQIFGERLRELRVGGDITQDALALGAGLTKAYISDMERGLKVPSLTTILRLAVALDCKVTALTSVFDQIDLPAILPK